MTIGERIKKRRLELDMSQSELAKRMGISTKSTISQLENGGDNITTDRIRRAAEALNVSESYLMGWEKSEPTTENANALADAFLDKRLMHIVTRLANMPEGNKDMLFNVINSIIDNFTNENENKS